MAAELSVADRELTVQHLQAAARWLSLLGTRLAGEDEPEAAALVEQARSDLVSVCSRLAHADTNDKLHRCHLQADPHRASTLFTPLAEAASSQSGCGWVAAFPG